MLLSDTLKKIERVANSLENSDNSELYAHINHDLAHIAESLKSDIKRATKELSSKIIAEQKDFQDATSLWVKNQFQDISKNALHKNSELVETLFATLSNEITATLTQKVEQKLSNLHEEIDIKTLTNQLKNDENLIQQIKTESINKTLESLQNEKDTLFIEIKAHILSDLESKTDINQIIQETLKSKEIINAILSQISEQLKAAIKETLKDVDIIAQAQKELEYLQSELEQNTINAKEASAHFTSFLEEIQQNMQAQKREFADFHLHATSELETTKQAQKLYIQAQAEQKKEELEQEITNIFHTFLEQEKTDFTQLKTSALEEITRYVSTLLYTDVFIEKLHVKLYESGLLFLQERKEVLEHAIIEATREELLKSITDERLRRIILEDTNTQETIKKAGFLAARDKLDNAILRDFVESALREKAQEILVNDEFLRQQAEAQAHLVAMRLQSQLESIDVCLKELEKQSDYSAQLELIAAQKAALQEAIKQAQQNLTNFLQNSVLQDFIIDSIQQNQANLESFLTQELQKIAQDLEQNIQNLPDLHTAKITALEATMQTQESKIQDLENKVLALTKELENVMQNPNTDQNNPNTPQTQPQHKEKQNKLAWV